MPFKKWQLRDARSERLRRDPALMERFRRASAHLKEVLPRACRPHHLAFAGFESIEDLRKASDAELLLAPEVGDIVLRRLRSWLRAHPTAGTAPLPAWVSEE
jgi:hypothetical protein